MTREEAVTKAAARAEYYRSRGFTCAESSIRTLAEIFDCPLPEEVLRAVAIFAGGAAVDGRCGISESSLVFIAVLFGGSGENRQKVRRYARAVQANMEKDLGSIMCSDLFYPRYKRHREKNEAEELFHCVFGEGTASVTAAIYDLLYAAK
jgi:C_GCAxxG_C_C family probable redox protein